MTEIKKSLSENIAPQQLSEAISERYLSYAISTIVSRSLPDVRDGLKPVHRRILYSMRNQKLSPTGQFRKCATVVGDVIGHYHPHGDSSIYDAMVRLAQDFSVRYPLIDGQGNFGNIDGDGAAAYRYTESRMTPATTYIIEGLSEDAVDFIPNFDGSSMEPVIMPGAFPNLLANGSSGIAVGMATNIPTHNVSEVCDALDLLLEKPDSTTSQIMKKLVGPDFPTGGILTNDFDSIVNIYETGIGAFNIRSKWHKEDLGHGQYQIVITEIPYGVKKSELIENIADLIEQKKLVLIADILDESSTDVRVVIEPKSRTVDADIIMAHLFGLTQLEAKFNMNFNVLDSTGAPRVMPIRDVLIEFIKHQRIVLIRKTNYRLAQINNRIEILDGYLIAFLNLDRVIQIIRNNDEPKPILMGEFNLSDLQAESILNMKLRSLKKLEEMQIRGEDKALKEEKAELEKLIGDESLIKAKLSDIFGNIKKVFSKKTTLGARKTEWKPETEVMEVNPEDYAPKEPITVILSELDWIKAIKGHGDLTATDLKFKEGDSLKLAFHAYTNDKIAIFTSGGKIFTINANILPGGRGFGDPIRLIIDLGADEKIVRAWVYKPETKLLLVSRHGNGFITNSENILAQTKSGKQIMNVSDDNQAIICYDIEDGDDMVAFSGSNDKLLIFPLSEIPELNRGKGVILQKYNAERTSVLDVMTFKKSEGFGWTTGRGKTMLEDYSAWLGKRASQGRNQPLGFPRSGKFKN